MRVAAGWVMNVAGLAVLLTCSSVLATDQTYFETFSSGLAGWAGGSAPTLVPTGGVWGANDPYMRLTSNSNHLAAHNAMSQWTGDYTDPLIIGVKASLANFGNTPLSIRVLFFNTSTNRYSSLEVAEVPVGGQWETYYWTFSPIFDSGLQQVGGSVPVTTGMRDVTQIMFRHNIHPSGGGDVVTGALGIDNIKLLPWVPTPSGAGVLAMASLMLCRRRR